MSDEWMWLLAIPMIVFMAWGQWKRMKSFDEDLL